LHFCENVVQAHLIVPEKRPHFSIVTFYNIFAIHHCFIATAVHLKVSAQKRDFLFVCTFFQCFDAVGWVTKGHLERKNSGIKPLWLLSWPLM